MPDDRIYEGLDRLEAPEEIEWEGITMQVQKSGGTKARIVRVIHPDPSVYLDARYAPGTEIDLGKARRE